MGHHSCVPTDWHGGHSSHTFLSVSLSKRKAPRNTTRSRNSPPRAVEPEISLFIQAHEADVIREPRGHAASLALETRIVDGQVIVGEGLMKWRAEGEVKDDEGDGELDTGSQAEKAAPANEHDY